MESAYKRFGEMLTQATVSTQEFHTILGELRAERPDDEDLVWEYTDTLLHMPGNLCPEEWRIRAQQLATQGLIATVNDYEVEVPENEESIPSWDVLASRVINRRKKQNRMELMIGFSDTIKRKFCD